MGFLEKAFFEKRDEFGEYKKETLEENQQKNLEALNQLEKPIKNILQELRGEIDDGEYETIIGDDASGRIPALILNKVIKQIYSEKDYSAPSSLFISGSHPHNLEVHQKEQKIKTDKIIQHLKNVWRDQLPSKKILLVTEVIASGYTLKPICDALKAMGVNFEIATIGFHPVSGTYKIDEMKEKIESYLGTKITYGMFGTPELYDRKALSGVKKNPKEVLAKRSDIALFGLLKSEKVKEAKKQARTEVENITKNVIKWYKKLN